MTGNRIIDFHVHTFPDKIAGKAVNELKKASHSHAFSSGTANDLLRKMDENSIETSVVLPVASDARQINGINRAAAENNIKYKKRLISAAAVHPDIEDAEEVIYALKETGFKGVKIHPYYQNTDFDSEKYVSILKICSKLDLFCTVHAGLDIGYPGINRCTPEMIADVIEKTGPMKLILAHMGGWKMWKEAKDLLKGSGCYVDTSFSTGSFKRIDSYWSEQDSRMLGKDDFLEIIESYTPERVLFGTDSPWTDHKESIEFIIDLDLDERDRNLIFCENAKRLLDV